MTVTLNGKSTEVSDGLHFQQFLQSMELDLTGLVVLVNGSILLENSWNKPLKEQDSIDLLQFVSGG